MAKIHGLVKKLNKLYFLTPYDNMDDILDKLRDSDCSDLDDDIELGDESDTDSDWEYESEDERVLCGGGVGDADRGGVVGDADVVGADAGGGVGDADCGAGSSIVRVEDSVCRDSGNECDGLVGGNDVDQSDNIMYIVVVMVTVYMVMMVVLIVYVVVFVYVMVYEGLGLVFVVLVVMGSVVVVGGMVFVYMVVYMVLGVVLVYVTMELQICNGSLLTLLMKSYLMTPSL